MRGLGGRSAALLVGLLQGALLLVVGGVLLLERQASPRAWARTAPVDPNLPIRGRYVDLRLEVPITGPFAAVDCPLTRRRGIPFEIQVRDGRLTLLPLQIRTRSPMEIVLRPGQISSTSRGGIARLPDRLAFFIPPDGPDPSRRPAGDPLWVEVTLPRQGPPRPIRLGVERGGRIEPLELR